MTVTHTVVRSDMTAATDPDNAIARQIIGGSHYDVLPNAHLLATEYFGYWYRTQFGALPDCMIVAEASGGEWPKGLSLSDMQSFADGLTCIEVAGTHYQRQGARGGFRAYKKCRLS